MTAKEKILSLTAAANTATGKADADLTAAMASLINGYGQSGIEKVEWHQCPEAVRNYLANVTYDPSDYSNSQIPNYAPDTPVASNTKPIGKTVDGVTYYNEVPNRDTPFSSENTAGTLKPLDRLRWINSMTNNFRDLGGWACDGGTVKYGLLFRSGELNAADADLVKNRLGISTELDLTGDGIPGAITGLRHVGTSDGSYAMYALTPVEAWKINLRAVFDAAKYREPLVFHCAAGADRTGTLACIIEGILGVSQSDCDKDYELTSFYTERRRDMDYQGGGGADWRRLIGQITALTGSTFRDKCVNFVASLGFTAAEINAFRAAMIDGTPGAVTPSIDTYTVTNTLTNATSDNNAASATEYQPYTAKITPANGYAISSVQVKMGGADVTANVWSGTQTVLRRKVTVSLTNCTSDNSRASVIDGQGYAATLTAADGYTLDGATVTITMGGLDMSTFYKNGVIAIPNVTGDLEITVTAVKSAPSYTNQIPISTDTDGSIYNSIGYMLNMRLPTNGVPAAYDGCLVTGFIPFSVGDIIRVNKFCAAGSPAPYAKVVFYNANHTVIAAIQSGQLVDDGMYVISQPLAWTPGNTIHDLGFNRDVDISEATYLRLAIIGYNDVATDIVCTINEEIT